MQSTLDTLYEAQPYPGLRAFETEERDYFFGRERQLDELLRKLRSSRFMVVVGNAGSGKSSLVKASLIPRLKEGFAGQAGQTWRIATCSIQNNPIGNLAKQLAQRGVLHADEMMDPNYPAVIEQLLRRGGGNTGIMEAFKQANIKKDNLMIVIDQFEDIFRYAAQGAAQQEEAATFVSLLLNASRHKDVPIYILLTMRSSALGDCTDYRSLPEAINDGQFLIPRMKPEELRKVIIAPPAALDIAVDSALANKLLDDAGQDFDELAVLQHTMMRTWEHFLDKEGDNAENVKIGIKHYDAVGGIKYALSNHTESVYAELESEDRQRKAERIFKALAEKGADGKAIRRACTMKELMHLTQSDLKETAFIINTFSQVGRQFLTAPALGDMDEDSVISIAHESLISRWERLHNWVDEEYESAQTFLKVSEAAATWGEGKGSLWRDPELTVGLQWLYPNQFAAKRRNPSFKREDYDKDPSNYAHPEFLPHLDPNEFWAVRYAKNFPQCVEFLDKSERVRQADLAKVEEGQNQKMRRATLIAAFSALFGLICILLLGVAIMATAKARVSAKEAYRSQQASQRSRYLAELNKQEADQQAFFARLSAKLAEEEKIKAANATAIALDAANDAEKSARKAEAERINAINAQRIAELKTLEAEKAKTAAEQAKIIAENQARLAREATRVAIATKGLSLAQSVAVKSLSVQDEKVEALLAKEAHDLNVINGGKPYDPYIYNGLYKAMDKLNPDFNAIKNAPAGVKRIGAIRALCVSKDGQHIYSTGSEGFLLKSKNQTFATDADHRKPENLPVIIGKNPSVYRTMAMSADGKFLVRAGDNGNVEVFDISKDNEPPHIIRSATYGRIWSLVLLNTEDGKTSGVIFADNNGSLQYASLKADEAAVVEEGNGSVIDMALSFDGKFLFTVDGVTDAPSIWQVKNGKLVTDKLEQSENFVINKGGKTDENPATAVAFSPNGQYVAIGYRNGMVRIWDAKTWETNNGVDYARIPEPLHNHQATIQDLTFSPDSRLLAAASMDKSASVWQVELALDKSQPYKDAKFSPIKLNDHSDWVMSVAFTPGNDRLITGTANGIIKIWEMDMFKYADQICEKVQGNLSDKSWEKYIGTDDPSGRTMYIKTPDGGQRTPVSTCSPKYQPLIDIE